MKNFFYCIMVLLTFFCVSAQADNYCMSTIDQRVEGTRLNLQSCKLTSSEVQDIALFLSQNPYIESLYLDNNALFPDDLAQIFINKQNITTLSISNDPNLNERGARVLSKFTTLDKLVLDNSYIGPEGAAAIAKLPNLGFLSVVHCGIGDKGAIALGKSPKLYTLIIENNFIGHKGAKGLAKSKSLRGLVIQNNPIRDDGAIALARNSKMTWLVLDNTHITDKAIEFIAFHTKQPWELDVDNNDITDEGALALSKTSNPNGISKLYISYNLLTKAGLTALETSKKIYYVRDFGNPGNEEISPNLKQLEETSSAFLKK